MRHVMMVDLSDDPADVAAYLEWHRPGGPPAAVTQAIRQAGIVAMDIYHAGDRLVMVMETGPNYDPARKAADDAANPEVQAWEALMDRYQRRLPFAPETKWVEARRIYALDEQP